MATLSDHEQKTIQAYRKIARDWSDEHMDANFWQEEIERLYHYLANGKVLEIGCGGGRDAKLLIEKGYEYVGTDVVEGFVELARQNNPDGTFEYSNLYDLNYGQVFDGFWCAAVLLHVPKKKIQKALSSIIRNIKPAGVGFISVKMGEGEKVESDTGVYKGERFFSYWQQDELAKELKQAGFEVVEQGIKTKYSQDWLTYIVRAQVSG